ncbi:MAG: ribbon-helix-helix protein, CopG family [Candidatus Rokubacteria bacterium]|nr:ribbon-helix-helix protein, CopG family [Candidatus Rokubacteria bacterium]
MPARATMTISLPPAMIREVEKVRKAEHRTRSELIREALRVYLNRVRTLPVYTPTTRELREIEKGRAAMRRGEYYTLDEFFRALDGSRRQARRKDRRSRASA